MNINVNNYKEYLEKYSTIEIEIIPAKNKYGNFINIDDENRLYYHIFFNDNKEEIQANYITEKDKVIKINIIVDYQILSFQDLFFDCKYIETINLKKFNRTNINNMHNMFYGCSSLKEINNLSKLKTDNVTSMSGIYLDCSSLREIDLSNFKTDKVTSMRVMFKGCYSLKEINISSFNIDNVRDMVERFEYCKKEIIKNIKSQNKNFKEEAFLVHKVSRRRK